MRNRITNWFKHCESEHFLLYVQDKDFAKSEAGLGGVVVTNRRLVFHKFVSHREFKLEDKIEMSPRHKDDKYELQITTGVTKPVHLHCDPADAQSIRNTLRNLGAPCVYQM